MKNYIILISCLIFVNVALSQNKELTLLSKTKSDSLYLKWIPGNVKTLEAILKEETIIEWVECDRTITDAKSLDFQGINKIMIKPLASYYDSIIEANDSLNIYAALFLEDIGMDSLQLGNSFINSIVQSFLDKEVSRFMGNTISISKINKSKSYGIRISNKKFESDFVEIVVPKKLDQLEITPVEAYVNTKKVNIEWDIKNLSNNYCAYNILKKSNKKFHKLNDIPILGITNDLLENPNLMFYLDKNVKQGETYFYQIEGIDFFGDGEGKSKIMKVYIPLEVNGTIIIDSIVANKNKRIIYNSCLSTDTINPMNVSEILLLRSDSLLEGYQVLKSMKLSRFEEKIQFHLDNYKTGDRYYYKTCLISKDLDTTYSLPTYFFTYDEDPPSPPANLIGTIDSMGIMRLSWSAPEDKDIQGYRVFKGNSKTDDFYEINKEFITQTTISDTLPLNTLTNEVYYFVKTVDLNFNNSISSDTVLLLKPDTIPPSPGVFKTHSFTSKGITLNWNNSRDEGLKYQSIVKTVDGHESILYTWTDTSKNSILDTNVISGKQYRYLLIASDQSNNIDSSAAYYVNFELGYRPALKTLKAIVDKEKMAVRLNWEYPIEEVFSYQIYKSKEGGPYKLLKTISKNEKQEYVDNEVKINNKYSYKITILLESGISTIISTPVEVTY
jgi:uncharacterized protein